MRWTIATLTDALAAIAEFDFRIRLTIDATHLADVPWCGGDHSLLGLPGDTSLAIPEPLPDIPPKKQKKVCHARSHHDPLRTVSPQQSHRISQPRQPGEPTNLYWQDEKQQNFEVGGRPEAVFATGKA